MHARLLRWGNRRTSRRRICELFCWRRGRWHGPVCVAKLPAAVAIFRSAGAETCRVRVLGICGVPNFVIGGSHDGEIRSERVNAQVVAPVQLDFLDCGREGLDSGGCGGAVWERHLAIYGHEECGAVLELPTPGGWAVLGNVVGDGLGEGFYGGFDRCGLRWWHGLRPDWFFNADAIAACECQD